MTGGHYETAVRKAGLDFSAMFSEADFNKIVEHPDLYHPRRGIQLVYRQMCLPWVSRVYDFIAEHAAAGEVGVVASTLVFGARVAQEKLHVPTVTVHVQPTFFRSVYETPTYPGLPLKNLPRWLKRILYRGMDLFLDQAVAADLNAFRRSLGLAPIHRFFADWIHSPDCALGLFPPWFAPPQPDWPVQSRLTGFPLYDGTADPSLSIEVRRFLDAGDPPVIFTAGSPMKQGKWFFEATLRACRRLRCREILVNSLPDQLPAALPGGVLCAPFVPFSELFPRSRGVVHHGGIGTLALGFAAGIPQVIVPIALDMPDHASRMERLGVGLQISRERFNGHKLAGALSRVLDEPIFREKAQTISRQMNGPKAVAAACDVIEETLLSERKP